jgi:LuxR family maltose regulon positive regulatory protein
VSTQLLTTKLYVPPPRPNLVPRPHLIKRLNAGLGPNHGFARKLTLISAPAGFGKTTLLSEWIVGCGRPVAWVSLDEGDNDPVRFLTYLVGALRNVDKSIGQSVESVLQSPQPSSTTTEPTDQTAWIETATTALVNDVTAAAAAFVLVLDDYHLISAAPVHRILQFLLQHQPPSMYLVVSTRQDPPLPLPRLRVRGQMTEIRERDLRFTEKEAAAFLNRTMELHLSTEEVTALETRTEGWIAGLQLAALSLRERENAGAFIAAFTGDDRHVMDYLIEEVLNRQPEAVRIFLLHTSILSRLSAPLCDALVFDLGLGDSSQDFLERLDTTNLFLVPLDNKREWYRYHHLFADLLNSCLRQTTSQERIRELHRRASQWHQDHGLLEEAVKHAMAAQDFKRAALMIGENILTMLYRNEPPALLSWIDKLSDLPVQTHLWVNVYHAWTLAMAGQEIARAEALLREAEEWFQPDTPGRGDFLGITAAARAYIASLRGDGDRAIELAHLAEEYLPDANLRARASVVLALADTYFARDDMDSASQALSKMLALGKKEQSPLLTVLAMCDLANVNQAQGRLYKANALYERAHQLMLPQGGMQSLVRGPFEIGQGGLLCEWNDLQAARDHVTVGIEYCQQFRTPSYLVLGYVALMRVLRAQGDMEGTLDALRQAEQAIRAYHVQQKPTIQIRAERIRLWLAMGDLQTTNRWADECGDSEPEQIALARVYLAQGKVNEALHSLDRQNNAARSGGRTGRLIEILTLQAVALQTQGQQNQALTALEHALILAEPEGYVRIFVNEGAPIGELLRQLVAQGVAMDYVNKLLTALSEETRVQRESSRDLDAQPLVDPLSERELEVLRLLAVGLSNKEIAQTLVIAASTVKQHLKSIYGKLDVHSRTQAVARARELNIL